MTLFRTFSTDNVKTMKVFPTFELTLANCKLFSHVTFVFYSNKFIIIQIFHAVCNCRFKYVSLLFRMTLLTLLWLLLTTLVGLSVQQCTIEKAETYVNNTLRGLNPENEIEADVNFTAYVNCLSTSKKLDEYDSISISAFYNSSQNQNIVNEIRFELSCSNNIWSRYRESYSAFMSDTRTDCSDCRNATVNEHRCTR